MINFRGLFSAKTHQPDPFWICSNGQSGTNLIKKFFDLSGLEFSHASNVTADSGFVRLCFGNVESFDHYDPQQHVLVGVNYPGIAHSAQLQPRFQELQHGQYGAGHMLYSEAAQKMFEDIRLKIIVIVRKPRDWAYSNARIKVEVKQSDLQEELMATVFGQYDVMGRGTLSLLDRYQRLSGWKNYHQMLTIKFENLLGVQGGGTDISQEREIQKICRFVGLKLNSKQVDHIKENIFGGTGKFRFGQINKWQEVGSFFDDPVIESIMSKAGKLFDYE